MSDESTDKRQFALAMLREPDDTYKAALAVTKGDIARALIMSREWPNDPEVIEHTDELVADVGEAAFLPSKSDLVREVWKKAKGCLDPDDAFKGFKLVADLMGYVEKPGTVVNNNTLVDQRKVMVVTDHGTDEEWEAKLVNQQAALTHVNAQPPIN